MTTNYCILSFCGGGVRGMISAGLLARLHKEWGSQILGNCSLFAGTSTGAQIISLLENGDSPAEIYAGYIANAKKIFGEPSGNADEPAYKVSGLLQKQTDMHGAMKMMKAKLNTLFTSFKLGNPSWGWNQVLFGNLTTPQALYADAVVSSSAMPGMFGSLNQHIDGAFADHEPSLAAIGVTVHGGQPLDKIAVLNLGTGLMSQWISTDTSGWGATQWQTGSALTVKDKAPALLVQGTPGPVLNAIMNDTSTTWTGRIAGMLLSDNYWSMNPSLDGYDPPPPGIKGYIAESDCSDSALEYMAEVVASFPIKDYTPWLDLMWK